MFHRVIQVISSLKTVRLGGISMHKLKHGEHEKHKKEKEKGVHSHLLKPPTACLSPLRTAPLIVKSWNDPSLKPMFHRRINSTFPTTDPVFLPTKTFDVQIPPS